MIAHIAKRIGFVVLGYFAAIATGSAAFPCILALMSLFLSVSELWEFLGLGPVAFIAAPIVFFFVMWIVVVLTFLPAAIVNILAEILGWRALWAYLVIAVAVSAAAGLLLMPDWFAEMSEDRILITVAAALSALLAGLVYWAIAGRNAGLREAPAT